MTDTHDTTRRDSGAGAATDELPPVCPRTGLARTGAGCLHCAYSVKVAGWWTCAFRFLGACESDVTPAQAVEATLGPKVTGETSDGYHTFNELYHHRAVLFSVIVRDHRELAWKSKLHHDGTMYDGMFIVGIETPQGQATYHYDIDPYWEMFDCMELDQAPEWDGHTPSDAIERIATLGRGTCHMTLRDDMRGHAYQDVYECSECGEQVVRETYMGESEPPKFCPSCGREVVEE